MILKSDFVSNTHHKPIEDRETGAKINGGF